MADDVNAAATAAARERLAADLRDLGAALTSLQAQPDLAPEVQELISSWDHLRSRALLDAASSEGGGLQGGEAAAEAAAALLQTARSAALVSANPSLVAQAFAAICSLFLCSGIEGWPPEVVPIVSKLAGGVLEYFLNQQLDSRIRSAAGGVVASLLCQPGCAACLLAAPGAGGTVEALIAAARREGELQRDDAFALLAALVNADAATAERAASAEAALLPIAVERIRSGAAPLGPLRLVLALAIDNAGAVRAHVRAAPGLGGAAVDLLMALGAAHLAVQQGAPQRQEMLVKVLWVLCYLMVDRSPAYPEVLDALTSRGALPRLLALLRSPNKEVSKFAACALDEFARQDAGADALFKVPRAASELAAALRRAYADDEDPPLAQYYAAHALSRVLDHSEGGRVAEALARAAVAEGSTGSLLGALAGQIMASVSYVDSHVQLGMLIAGASVLARILMSATAAEQLRVIRRVPLLPEACILALDYWQPRLGNEHKAVCSDLFLLVACAAGFDRAQAVRLQRSPRSAQPPAATADTAAARAALRAAPGMEGMLRLYQDWLYSQPAAAYACGGVEVVAIKWLLALPEVRAPAAPTAAGPASAGPTAAAARAPAAAAAAPPPGAAGGSSAAAKPLVPEAGSGGSSRADGSGPSCSSGGDVGSGGGSGAEAAARPPACGGCGKSAEAEAPLLRCAGCRAQHYCGKACATAHWPSHRAACKAARTAAAPRS
ncbi:hypothetical protein Rsub_11167 [Raphidocelis subcapitata]|uniref:MYND-type domain-containing protein n=1 Tax=Raphidocelis subcapitata TaxID=307507 RepID=A0A2V0PG13_9CHLO|nr:hypothetical protein Rsub_11167 [Raphidocelis subcapitata]|eukprot:GBF98761.1 hypothetical protein Rsub_11167 [Raphidocelis subcapitata]